MRSDPEKYTREKEKERQRYLKRKESKKILSIKDLTPKAKKLQRKKWRENFNKFYQRKLLLKQGQKLMDVNTPSDSETNPLRNDNDEEHEQHDIRDHDTNPEREQRNEEVLSETKHFTVRERNEETKKNYYQKLKQDIATFFDRDDISRMTAGKKECISRDKIKKQRRYLLDSMKNLHKFFEAENTKVSYSYFCQQRPFWVLIPDVSDRETCLCKTHANIELLLNGPLLKTKS
ncbi:uncharacterized protein LOC126968634 [Leptidea sinapis]|uniref:uncharacterized protein LOC126968634 n=1 Tax=Leptidea sinapis TaxID=189913 RepID=UPI0021C48F1D|nr:uncharacterized protein LOC126968634 [Leptidea sinapis]